MTKLLWTIDANYFGKNINGTDAIRACENLIIAGLSGWRLPLKEELERMFTIINDQEPHPFRDLRKGYYLTTTQAKDKRFEVYLVDLIKRKITQGMYGYKYNYWPVRGSGTEGTTAR